MAFVKREMPEDFIQNSHLPYRELNLLYKATSKTIKRWKDECESSHGVAIRRNIPRRVVQYSKRGQLVGTFRDAAAATRKTFVSRSSICQCCNGKLKSAGGFIWKYV